MRSVTGLPTAPELSADESAEPRLDEVGVTETAPVAPALDTTLAAAVEIAHAAALEVGGGSVGEYLGVVPELERVVTHAFMASLTGYSGWYWAVTLARAPRSKSVTVDEVVLLPGADALLAPEWVPWQERLQPGDLSPGDILPADPDDPRLVPAYSYNEESDARQVKDVGLELGLGRVRVMSRDGRLDAADRWQTGDFGPKAPMAKQAPAHCGTCGFLLMLAGSLSAGFGVCGNDITDTDGRVVSVEYGCGAHSEVKVSVPSLAEPSGAVYDDGDDIEVVRTPTAVTEAVVETVADAVDEVVAPVLAAELDDPAAQTAPAENSAD